MSNIMVQYNIAYYMYTWYFQHPSLCRFPSSAFYDKQLITNPSPKRETLQALSIWRDPNNPFVFCDMEGDEEYLENTSEEGNEMSRFNRAEINQVVSIILKSVLSIKF